MKNPFQALRQRRDELLAEASTSLANEGDTVAATQEARLVEIVAELEQVDAQRWDLAEKKAAEITTATATAAATAQLRAADIAAACMLADRPHFAGEFIRSRLNLADVRAELKARLVDDFAQINEHAGPPHRDRGQAALDRAIAAIGQDLRGWEH